MSDRFELWAVRFLVRSLDPFIQESGWCQNWSMMETEEPQVVWQEGGKGKEEGGNAPCRKTRQLSAVDHQMCSVVWRVNLLNADHLEQTSISMKTTRSFKAELLTGSLLYPLSDRWCPSGVRCSSLVCLIRETSSFSPVFTASGKTLDLSFLLKQFFFVNSICLEGDGQRFYHCRALMRQNQHDWWCHYPRRGIQALCDITSSVLPVCFSTYFLNWLVAFLWSFADNLDTCRVFKEHWWREFWMIQELSAVCFEPPWLPRNTWDGHTRHAVADPPSS